MKNMGGIFLGSFGAMLGMVMLTSVAQAYAPRLDYICPVCAVRFATYDELVQHFTIEHPADPIEVIWS
ncbi:MAG: hypothetical protein PHQ43_07085 [Dehalococcoidales bacterium]|nr:hypothetical protein [Dehalococcoidales bacterium]